MKFTKNDSVCSYFLKIAQINNQLAVVNESVPDKDLVLTSMGDLPSGWKTFVKEICACGQLPTFDQFWLKCIQEETRERASTSKEKDEVLVLVAKI